MSASAITQGLIDNLSAGSVFGACQVATHWAVLETSSGCAAVINLQGMESTPWAYNNKHERFYTHRVNIYVKDRSGNGLLLERDIQGIIDKSACSLEVDRTLQGNLDIREVSTLTVSHDQENVLEAGGATWYIATIDVRTREWPDN